ncbi:MAG: hypothetical protein JO290_06705 [Sphingomonadaceae bacterium]|nr:hypothetical protein [Sphingomonadaceae bacterium]
MADEPTSKVDQIAEEALEAGRKFVATDTGKKVADAADAGFAKAEELARKAMDSDLGRKALDSDAGRQASDYAAQASDKVRELIPNELARNVAVGAVAGAVVAIPIPFVGSLFGAVIGGGLGFLRTLTKQR